eukprot:Rhum_TRINITY_DN9842_c0_g1::Rhum_TRINITY_DN9842_c0_g1_i1::g.35313::m.35313
MFVTASWGKDDVVIEVGAECRTLKALTSLIAAEFPTVDMKKACLERDGRTVDDDEAACLLEDGCTITVVESLASRAAAALRAEGHSVDSEGFRAVAVACDVRLTTLYLDAEVPWLPGSDKASPLHVAAGKNEARSGHLALCQLFLDRGFDVNAKGSLSTRPLHIAASRETCPEVLQLLLDAGADPNAQDYSKNTPLHLAGMRRDPGVTVVVKLLLDGGADANHVGKNEFTPLHTASATCQESVYTLLIERGATLDARTDKGRTPLHRAATSSAALCKVLLDRECDPNAQDNEGLTPLHHAAAYGKTSACEVLLDCGAAIDAKDEDGRTPLWKAATGGYEATCALLIERGSDQKVKDRLGCSVRNVARDEVTHLWRD